MVDVILGGNKWESNFCLSWLFCNDFLLLNKQRNIYLDILLCQKINRRYICLINHVLKITIPILSITMLMFKDNNIPFSMILAINSVLCHYNTNDTLNMTLNMIYKTWDIKVEFSASLSYPSFCFLSSVSKYTQTSQVSIMFVNILKMSIWHCFYHVCTYINLII